MLLSLLVEPLLDPDNIRDICDPDRIMRSFLPHLGPSLPRDADSGIVIYPRHSLAMLD